MHTAPNHDDDLHTVHRHAHAHACCPCMHSISYPHTQILSCALFRTPAPDNSDSYVTDSSKMHCTTRQIEAYRPVFRTLLLCTPLPLVRSAYAESIHSTDPGFVNTDLSLRCVSNWYAPVAKTNHFRENSPFFFLDYKVCMHPIQNASNDPPQRRKIYDAAHPYHVVDLSSKPGHLLNL